MTAPDPTRQKDGWREIDGIFADAKNTWVIHYSCESFYDRPEGRSPRVTSIAVRKLSDAQTHSFSIHQVAERQGVAFREIEQHYDRLERVMLDAFFAFIGSYRNSHFLHWNMRDANYGFPAIEHRYTVLGGAPITIDDERKHDLSRIIINIYGKGYISHPRLESLIERNKIRPLDFMTGPQEAKAFEERNFNGLHQSTLRKVDILANLATLVKDRSLKTNTTHWDMHGGRIRAAVYWILENKLIAFFASIASIVGLGLAIYALK
ncbi:hypothetical protein [Mesorhizobium sp. WSM4906]|uniref:hypothetical protein n=1 Tax=Mesorhizobium sp. WSM4906 TaxID=3038546 RepID=UPI002416CCBB|nr:hypothetical protein [Mesorhizobium sp. WSM4906]WFP78743.1 hypothetical protein QAZ22_13445 [Mesorhizobium sp. WSM4906]